MKTTVKPATKNFRGEMEQYVTVTHDHLGGDITLQKIAGKPVRVNWSTFGPTDLDEAKDFGIAFCQAMLLAETLDKGFLPTTMPDKEGS